MSNEFPTSFPSPEDAQRKKELSQKIKDLMEMCLPTPRIVTLLGPDAEDFLTAKPNPGRTPTYYFDARGFIEMRLTKMPKLKVPESYIKCSGKIIQPGEGEFPTPQEGEGRKRTEENVPRIAYLTELVSDMDLPYSIAEEEGEKMEGYVAFIIPSLEKIVFVNNEKGNATFIIHQAKPEDWKAYIQKTKNELKSMPLVTVVNYPTKERIAGNEWKDSIRQLLLEEPSPRSKKSQPEFSPALPEDRTIGGLAKELALDNKTVQRLVEQVTNETTEKIHPYERKKSPTGNVRDYLRPEILSAVRRSAERLTSRPQAPENWKTLMAVAKESGMDVSAVSRIIREIMATDPSFKDEIGNFANPTRRIVPYYSPRIIEEVLNRSKDRIPAPTGWKTAKALSKQLSVDDKTIQRYAKLCLEQMPVGSGQENIKSFKSPLGNVREYFSPELSQFIAKEIETKVKSRQSKQTTAQGSSQPESSSREET